MTHDAANTERFRAVIDLCDKIDEFLVACEDPDDLEDNASQQVLDAVGHFVGMVLHSISQRKHHAVTIDARFGINGHDAAPITVTHHSAPRQIRLELAPDMQAVSDHPVWQTLEKLHNFISDEYGASTNHDSRRLLDTVSLTIGGIDLALREDKVTNTLVCTDAKDGLVNVTAMPMRME